MKILFFVLLTNTLYSQNYEYLKKLDTIYIPFKQDKYNVKVDYPEEKNGFKNRSYIFNYKKKNESSFYFELDRNKVLENREIKKTFIEKNKKKTITINSLREFDSQDIACDLFNRSKIIYIIDFTEKRNKNVTLYRVMPMGVCFSIE